MGPLFWRVVCQNGLLSMQHLIVAYLKIYVMEFMRKEQSEKFVTFLCIIHLGFLLMVFLLRFLTVFVSLKLIELLHGGFHSMRKTSHESKMPSLVIVQDIMNIITSFGPSSHHL